MTHRFLYVILCLAFVSACAQAPQNKEAVRQAVVDHLAKNSGLDLGSMNVEVTSLTFRDKEADATIAFRPKASPAQGMQMNYTLVAEGRKWVVQKKAGSQGAAPHDGAAGAVPEGHPPVSPETAK